MCLKGQLAEREISFEEVGIEHSPKAAALVESLNNGNQMVLKEIASGELLLLMSHVRIRSLDLFHACSSHCSSLWRALHRHFHFR